MFYYKTGIDITNDKQMFNFLKNHFTYHTANSWNRGESIANNVKLNRMGLSGPWPVALSFIEAGEIDTITYLIDEFKENHHGYDVFFNGQSGGYLVLVEDDHAYCNVLTYSITECDTYEDYKEFCRENYGSVKANREELVYMTNLVRDFDKLCDELRDYCDALSKLNFEAEQMRNAVERFNEYYADDLEELGYSELICDADGKVSIAEISRMRCLLEAFYRIANIRDIGYDTKCTKDMVVYYETR